MLSLNDVESFGIKSRAAPKALSASTVQTLYYRGRWEGKIASSNHAGLSPVASSTAISQ